jgi:hypothetical protein
VGNRGVVPEEQEGDVLSVYSDASLNVGGASALRDLEGREVRSLGVVGGVYAWMVGGVEGGEEVDDFEFGWMMKEGWVDGGPGVMDSTRAELEGVLGAMRGLWGLWEGGVIHRLDNEGVVKVYEEIERYETGRMDGLPHVDVWEEVLWWKRRWGGRYVVKWHRGHPEERKLAWVKHDQANFHCDLRCDFGMKGRWPWGEVKGRRKGEGLELWVGGVRAVRGMKEAVKDRLGDMRLQRYMDSRGVGAYCGKLSRVAWGLDRGKGVGIMRAVQLSKYMWGRLPSNRMLWERGEHEDGGCGMEGCGGDCEDGWHVFGACRARCMVECRRKWMGKLRKQVDGVQGMSEDVKWAVQAMWSVGEDGEMVRWEELRDDGERRQMRSKLEGELRKGWVRIAEAEEREEDDDVVDGLREKVDGVVQQLHGVVNDVGYDMRCPFCDTI